jgi:hypothetical protein
MEKNPYSVEGKSAGELLEAIKSLEHNPFILSQHFSQPLPSKIHRRKPQLSKKSDENNESGEREQKNQSFQSRKFTLNLDNSISLTMKAQQQRSQKKNDLTAILPNSSKNQKESQRAHNKYEQDTSKFLSDSKHGTISEIHSIESETNAQIQSALSLIPAQYFISHNLFDQVKSKSLESMMKILLKMRIRLLKQGLFLWHSTASRMTSLRRSNAISLLNRMIRGYLGRIKAKKVYKQQLQSLHLQKKREMKKSKSKYSQIIRIQSMFRRWLERKKYLRKLLLHRNAIKIQRRFRSYYYHGRILEIVNEMIRRNGAAKMIQRVYRGFLGRMLSRIRRSEVYRLTRESRYETSKGIFELYFEQHGAAHTLQHWYRSLWWVVRLRSTQREQKIQLIHERKARIIQKMIRGYLIRKRFQRRNERDDVLKDSHQLLITSIILIQSLVRRYLTRCHHTELLLQFNQHQKRRKRQVAIANARKPFGKRRLAISFSHLKIGNERNIMRLERKATVIQHWYKSCRILRYFLRFTSHSLLAHITSHSLLPHITSHSLLPHITPHSLLPFHSLLPHHFPLTSPPPTHFSHTSLPTDFTLLLLGW